MKHISMDLPKGVSLPGKINNNFVKHYYSKKMKKNFKLQKRNPYVFDCNFRYWY